jgi:hypothetical protein
VIQPVAGPAAESPIHRCGEAMHEWEVTPQPLPAREPVAAWTGIIRLTPDA